MHAGDVVVRVIGVGEGQAVKTYLRLQPVVLVVPKRVGAGAVGGGG